MSGLGIKVVVQPRHGKIHASMCKLTKERPLYISDPIYLHSVDILKSIPFIQDPQVLANNV